MNKIVLSGSFGRGPKSEYISNILPIYTIQNNCNTMEIMLNINNVIITNNTIDIDIWINNIITRKSIYYPKTTTINMNYEFKVKINDIIKIIGSVSGISYTNPLYTIMNTSYLYCYIKTENCKNLISINNIYNDCYVKIINEIYNKTISNFRISVNNITPTEKKNETEKCKTILSGDVNAPSVRACFHLTAFYSG
jgi:hypothetical protein